MKPAVLFLLLASPAAAQPGAWQVAASTSAVLAAESVVAYRGAPAGLKADAAASANADVVVVRAEEREGTWAWALLPLSTGTVTFTARFVAPDGKAVSAPPVTFVVAEAEIAADADITDIKEPLKARASPWPWLLAAALLGLGVFAWYKWKNRRRAVPGGAPVPLTPVLPPEVEAELAIEKLRVSGLWGTDQAAYYLSLTDILRVYLEARYAKPVTAMTSVEVERFVKQRVDDLKIGGSVRELLARADLVKFAKVKPGADEGPRDADLALSVVKATTPKIPSAAAEARR